MTCRANFVVSCGFKFALEDFPKKVQKGGVQRAAKGIAGLVVAERERTTQSPNRKGVKMMEAIPRDYGQGQFDAFCKKVLKNEARADEMVSPVGRCRLYIPLMGEPLL